MAPRLPLLREALSAHTWDVDDSELEVWEHRSGDALQIAIVLLSQCAFSLGNLLASALVMAVHCCAADKDGLLGKYC